MHTLWDITVALTLLAIYGIALVLAVPFVLFVLWSDRRNRR